MKSKSFMLMILSMGFGLIAAIGISQVMGRSSSNAAPVQEMGTVLVAADMLDMKTHLNEENVKIENWPKSIIPEDAVTSLEEIADMGIKTRLSKGMPIVKSEITNVNNLNTLTIPDGFKVVAVKVSADDTISGLLTAGDKGDVMGLFKRRDSFNRSQTTTRTFLKGLRVFSVGNQMRARDDRSEGAASGSTVVGVLVTERQSEEIFYVQRTGEIKLVLRGDYQESDNDVQSLEDIIDWGDKPAEAVAEVEPEGKKRGFFSSFGAKTGQQMQESSMIMWIGNEPEMVTFQHGALPKRSGGAPKAPARPEGPAGNADESNGEDFDGSNEIDRSLEQDQYRGL